MKKPSKDRNAAKFGAASHRWRPLEGKCLDHGIIWWVDTVPGCPIESFCLRCHDDSMENIAPIGSPGISDAGCD